MNKFTKLVLLVFIVSLVTINAASTAKNIKVYYNVVRKIVINGKDKTSTKNKPFVLDGTTYVPLRYISEQLGKKVDWNNKTGTITISDNSTEEVKTDKQNTNVGTRSNPVPLGQTYTFAKDNTVYGNYKFDMTIKSALRGNKANEKVIDENSFNEKADETTEYIVANINFKLLEIDETNEFFNEYGFSDFNLKYISKDGVEYSEFPPTFKDSIHDVKLFKGGEKSCDVGQLIKKGDEPLIKLHGVWFSLK